MHSKFKTTALTGAVLLALSGGSALAQPKVDTRAEVQSLRSTVEELRKQLQEVKRASQANDVSALERARLDELRKQLEELRATVKAQQGAAVAAVTTTEGESQESIDARTAASKADIQGLRTDLENYKYDNARQLERNVPSVVRNTKIGGGVTLQYNTNNPAASASAGSSGGGATEARNNGFAAPAVSLNLTGTLYRDYAEGKNLTYRFGVASNNATSLTNGSTVSGSSATASTTTTVANGNSFLNVQDAYVRYSFLSASGNPEDPLGTITVGQQAVPFGLDPQALDPEVRPVINSSQLTTGLGLGRQVGIVVSGDYDPYVDFTNNYRAPLLAYSFGVFDGNGTNRADNNNHKDFVGRLVYTLPVDYASWLRQIQVGTSYYHGQTSLNSSTNTVTASAATKTGSNDRTGFDINWTHLPYSISYEWANIKKTVLTGGDADGKLRSTGQYINFGYTWGEQFLNSSKSQGKFDDYWPLSYQAFVRFDEYDANRNDAVKNDKSWVRTVGVNIFFAETSTLRINHVHQTNQGPAFTASRPETLNGWAVQLSTTF